MKFLIFLITILSFNVFAIPSFTDKGVIKEKLEMCSNTEVTVISDLYIGEGLDKSCLINEFNKVFKMDPHKNWFAYTDWSDDTRTKLITVTPEYQTEINDYVPGRYYGVDYENAPIIENIKSVTSLWADSCGERCRPAQDFLYELEDKFWYLVPSEMADMSILKIDDAGKPLLIMYKKYFTTLAKNLLIHLPKKKEFDLGSGGLSITELSLKEMQHKKSGSKSYFIGGGAYWFDSKTTLNFEDGITKWKYINASGEFYRGISCLQKEEFLERTGRDERGFEHLTEVCYYR